MRNLVVAVLGAPGYAQNLGKKTTSTDITLYDLKKGENIVTFVEPTRYPERLAPLFYAVSLAKKAIIVVDELNSTFGECIVMLQCSNVRSGYFILRNYLTRDKIEPIIKGTVLENFEFPDDNPTILKEKLLAEISQQKPIVISDGISVEGTVPIDHSFNVKGVGTVVLGIVMDGVIRKHGEMKVLPGNKTTQIRSIQKHDDEFDQASEGERVGLALRNIDVEDLERGTVLTSDSSIKTTNTLEVQASLVKYWPTHLKSGLVLHIGHWTQFILSRIESVVDEGDWRRPTLKLILEKDLVHLPDDQAILMYLEGGKLRIVGTIDLP